MNFAEKNITTGKNDYYFAEAAKVSAIMGACIHTLFIGYFVFVDVLELAYYNIFSSLFFLASFLLVKKNVKMVMPFVVLGSLEVLFHAGLATHYVGVQSGFALLIWVLPPLIILNSQFKTWVLLAACSFFAFVFLFIQNSNYFTESVYSLDNSLQSISFSMCFFGMIITDLAITLYFRKIVQEKEKIILREIHHRIKNNLQIVSSIANIRRHEISNKEVDTVVEQLRTDVSYLSTMHNQVSIEKDTISMDFTNFINESIEKGIHYNPNFSFKKTQKKYHLNLDLAIPLGMTISQVIENFYSLGNSKKSASTLSFSTNKKRKKDLEFLLKLNNPDIIMGDFDRLVQGRSEIANILINQLGANMICESKNGVALCKITCPNTLSLEIIHS